MDLAEYVRMHALERRHWWFRAKRRIVYALLGTWAPAPEPRVLDVGCGTGITLRELPGRYRGVGVDSSPEALGLCRQRGLRALARGSATELPIASAAFDAVLALDIIEHVDDDNRALSELARVLRPGGVAILTVPAFPFLWSGHDEALHHRRRYTRGALEKRLAGAGLAVRVGGYGYAIAFPAAVAVRIGTRIWRRGSRRVRSDVGDLPGWLNALAYRLTAWEVPLVRRGRLPIGLSLVYVVSPAGDVPPRSEPGTPDSEGASSGTLRRS